MNHDQELINAGIDVIREQIPPDLKYPLTVIRCLADKMIQQDKLGDSDWVTVQLAKAQRRLVHERIRSVNKGYAPFTHIGNKAWDFISERYDPWILLLMAEKLEDPEDIHDMWAVHFAHTAFLLGREKCTAAESLYFLVTESSEWKDSAHIRKEYRYFCRSRVIEHKKNNPPPKKKVTPPKKM